MARYFKSDLKSLTDPMLYSSILHAALVTAVFFISMNYENSGTGQFEYKNGKWEVNTFQYNDRQWFNKLEKTKPKVSEQYY